MTRNVSSAWSGTAMRLAMLSTVSRGPTVTSAMRIGLTCAASFRLMRRNVATASRKEWSACGVRSRAAKMKR